MSKPNMLEKIAGRLIADKDMHPATNIFRRKWIAGDMHGTYVGFWPTPDGRRPPHLYWVFPERAEDYP